MGSIIQVVEGMVAVIGAIDTHVIEPHIMILERTLASNAIERSHRCPPWNNVTVIVTHAYSIQYGSDI